MTDTNLDISPDCNADRHLPPKLQGHWNRWLGWQMQEFERPWLPCCHQLQGRGLAKAVQDLCRLL